MNTPCSTIEWDEDEQRPFLAPDRQINLISLVDIARRFESESETTC